MILTGSADEPEIYVLEDGLEIQITVIELEGTKPKIVVCRVRKSKFLTNTDY